VFAQNGIPWWYDIGLPADQPPPPDLGFLDPGAKLRSAVSKDRIIGGVIFSSNEITAPGIVVNDSPERNMLLVGECDDRPSQRIERLRAALVEAGIQSPPAPRIREAIWTKLTSNMSVSVLCSLTGQTARLTVEDPALQEFVPRLLDEAQAVARSCYPGITRRTGRAPDHLPSLRQDCDRGRPMEIDALVTAPAAFARAAGLSTPTLDTIAGLATRQARTRGCMGERLRELTRRSGRPPLPCGSRWRQTKQRRWSLTSTGQSVRVGITVTRPSLISKLPKGGDVIAAHLTSSQSKNSSSNGRLMHVKTRSVWSPARRAGLARRWRAWAEAGARGVVVADSNRRDQARRVAGEIDGLARHRRSSRRRPISGP
jgi:hypothetical protein